MVPLVTLLSRDNRFLRRANVALTGVGYRTVVGTSTAGVSHLLEQHRPNLVVIDLQRDHLPAQRRLLEELCWHPLTVGRPIVVTATPQVLLDLGEQPRATVLAKPIAPGGLVSTVRALLADAHRGAPLSSLPCRTTARNRRRQRRGLVEPARSRSNTARRARRD